MTPRALVGAAATTLLFAAACSGGDDHKSNFNPGGGSGGTHTGGGGSGGTSTGGVAGGGSGGMAGTSTGGMAGTSSGGVAGSGGTTTTGGTGGTGATGGTNTGGTGATGPETCLDGVDNDGNGLVDCNDSACTAKCASACAQPDVLTDPSTINASTFTHKDSLDASCGPSSTGPDVAFEFTAAKTGVFEAVLGGFQPMSLSVRKSSCTGTEAGCTQGSTLKLNVTAGDKLWVIVDGADGGPGGPFGLHVESRPIVCGDGHTDGTEACDDNNTKAGDGCSPTCTIELKETEPNDTVAQANTWTDPFTGIISGPNDVDVVAVTISTAGTTLNVSVQDFGDNACDNNLIDSYLELVDKNGTTLLSNDDNGGDGLCSAISKTGLSPGTYYLMVSAASGANPSTFAYKLAVNLT